MYWVATQGVALLGDDVLSASSSAFDRYIGVDYSGADTPATGLRGLRAYMATQAAEAAEVPPPAGGRKHWTRRGLAEWLVERLGDGVRTLVGIDHGFSFPSEYFEAHGLERDWPSFLKDFRRHWPTDDDGVTVESVRRGEVGDGGSRGGDRHWRRLTERRAGAAKSVFHFDVQGSVAKSTHAGIPWLLYIRTRIGERAHFWPFDGWSVPEQGSIVAEVYPALWSRSFPRKERTPDQHDAYSVASWLRQADLDGRLAEFFAPDLTPRERKIARVEGWILGVR